MLRWSGGGDDGHRNVDLAEIDKLGEFGVQVDLGGIDLDGLEIAINACVAGGIVPLEGSASIAERGCLADLLSFEISVVANAVADGRADSLITPGPLVQSVALVVVVVTVAIVILGLGRRSRRGLLGLWFVGLVRRRGCLRRPMSDGSLRDPAGRVANIEDIIIQPESTRVQVKVTLARGEVADVLIGPIDRGILRSRDAVGRIAQVVVGRGIEVDIAAGRRGRCAADISGLATPCPIALGIVDGRDTRRVRGNRASRNGDSVGSGDRGG